MSDRGASPLSVISLCPTILWCITMAATYTLYIDQDLPMSLVPEEKRKYLGNWAMHQIQPVVADFSVMLEDSVIEEVKHIIGQQYLDHQDH